VCEREQRRAAINVRFMSVSLFSSGFPEGLATVRRELSRAMAADGLRAEHGWKTANPCRGPGRRNKV
jgi:hypothetical protein